MYSQNDWRMYHSDELYHHGILGQKWHHRRFQNYDGSLTPEGKIRYLKGDHTVKAGTTVKRITTQLNEEIGSERKYVNYKNSDSNLYKNFYPYQTVQRDESPFAYQQEYTLSKDLKVAGTKAYNEAFSEIFKNNPGRFGKMTEKEANQYFSKYLQVRGNKLNDEFFKNLSDKGYDAVQDQYSKSGDKTKDPLIVLNPKESMVKGKTNIVLSNQQDSKNKGRYTRDSIQGRALGGAINTAAVIGGGVSGGVLAGPYGAIGGSVLGRMAADKFIGSVGYAKIYTIGNNTTKEVNEYINGLSDKSLSDMIKYNNNRDKELQALLDAETKRRS